MATTAADWPRFDSIYLQFAVTLQLDGPPIWREFLLRRDASFADLNEAIQACGWDGYHGWKFATPDGIEIAGPAEPTLGFIEGITVPAETVPLVRYFTDRGVRCGYIYDLSDCWLHAVQLTDILPLDADFDRALIDGEGRFPPEDCGGEPVWNRMLTYRETRQDPGHDPDLIQSWLSAGPFEPLNLEVAKRSFGAVLPDDPTRQETTKPRIQEIDGPLTRALAEHAEKTLREFVADVGLDVRVRRATYGETNAQIKIEVSTIREDGVVMNDQAVDFLVRCEDFGLEASDLGRRFRIEDGTEMRVIGLRPRAKQAILCEQLSPPRPEHVAFRADYVQGLLADEAPSSPPPARRTLRLLSDDDDTPT